MNIPPCPTCKSPTPNWKYGKPDEYVRGKCSVCGTIDWSLAPVAEKTPEQEKLI